MRKYILVALVLVVIGIGASLMLIPNEQDVAVMQARDVQTIDLGNVDIEAEYAQGRRTFPIINALVDKRIDEGNRPAAIALLEEYVVANPQDMNGHRRIVEQYQLAGNQAKYQEHLAIVASAEPTEENLTQLSYIYNADKNYPKQIEVLAKRIEVNGGKNPEYFADLATIQMVEGRKEDALATVDKLKAAHPDFTNYTLTYISTTILAENGKGQEAFDAANTWITANPNIKELTELVNILHYAGHADKAIALVEPRMQMLTEDTALVAAYVNANITAGRADHAFEVLTRVDQAGKMTPELYKPYLELALKRQDIPAAEDIAKRMDVVGFKEEDALNLLEIARGNETSSVFEILATRFGEPAVIADKPVLAAVIALIKNTKDQDQKIETALALELTSVQRVRLAEACARSGKTMCFDTIVSRFPAVADMNGPQVAEFAQIHILANRAKDIVDSVGTLAATKQQNEITKAHLRLASAAGRNDIMLPWIEANRQTAPLPDMQEYFYLANNAKHAEIAVPMAEALFARDPTPMNKDIVIASYLSSGQEAKALPMLREQAMKDGANDALYISALTRLARKDAAARKELTDYSEASLKAVRGDDKQQINYAYALINNGKRDKATPFVREYAKARGGEWKKMYAQLTARSTPGKPSAPAKPLTDEQLFANGMNARFSEANRESTAAELMKRGRKDEATKIYQALAENKSPESKEVKNLLYVWGGKLNTQQITWVMNRAKTANAYDKQAWNKIISDYGDDYAVLQYVSSTPDALYNQALRKKYFNVLAGSGGADVFDTNMRGWVAQTTDAAALIDYAKAGETFSYNDAAFHAYQRAVVVDPRNEYALKQLGVVAFGKGRYDEARQYFDRYFAIYNPSAGITDPEIAHYYRAQLFKQQNMMAQEQAEYQAIVRGQQARPNMALDAQTRYYIALMRLGQHAESKRGFEALLSQHPDNKGILGDYMVVLIEFKYFDDATRIANQYDKNSPYYGKSQAIMGRAGDVSSVERLSGGREMKISFAQPIEGKAPLKSVDHAWIEKTDAAYDSVTISAKPGYVVRFVPTTATEFAVVPAQAQSLTPQAEFERQQDLRLQMLYARIEQETGRTDLARQRLAALQNYYPKDPQVLTYAANMETAAGNSIKAIELLQQVQTVQPDNEDVARMVMDLRKQTQTNFMKLDHEYRSFGDNDEQITTLSGAARVSDRTEVGLNLKNDSMDTFQIRRAVDGLPGDYQTSRQQGEAYIAQYFDDSSRLQVSGFANNDTGGAGLYYAFNNPIGGRSELIGEYHRPYWDFVEAVYEHANRDRIGLRHSASINPTLSAGLETSFNNYNIKDADDVARTGLIRASLTQRVNESPFVAVGYGFDGEYLTEDRPLRRAANGDVYYPLPLRSREVHFLSGIVSGDITPSTHGLVQASYAYDRLGAGGPVVEGRL
ncbi:MAG: tetratricopeptide repeat protein, partial [Rickettsiales bacterium]